MAEPFPKLIVLSGMDRDQEMPLPRNGEIRMGRAEENQLAFPDASVSRHHATLIAREGQYFLRDENSRNGTLLEGQRLEAAEEVKLAHLDELRLGIYDILFAEKSYTLADRHNKRKAQTHVDHKAESAPLVGDNVLRPGAEIQAESLKDELLRDVQVPFVKKKKRGLQIAGILILICVAFLIFFGTWQYFHPSPEGITPKDLSDLEDQRLEEYDEKIRRNQKNQKDQTIKEPNKKEKTGALPPKKTRESLKKIPSGVDQQVSENLPLTPQLPDVKKTEIAKPVSDSPVVQPAETLIQPTTHQIFLDVKTEPIPAMLWLDDKRLGTSPLKTSFAVEDGKEYTLHADFELREVHDIYRKTAKFKAVANTDLVELILKADLAELKITRLPPRTEFYLEGFYAEDPIKSQPVKISDIRYGKPIYLPAGTYTVEIREQAPVSGSENKLRQVRYQRVLELGPENKKMEIAVTEKDLRVFPAIIKSNPTNATVYFNGVRLGSTPYRGLLSVGSGEIRVEKDGFFPKKQNVTMMMNAVYETTLVLETSKIGEMLHKAREKIVAGQWNEALPILIDSLKYGGTSREKAEAHLLLGQAYLSQSAPESAIPVFEKSLQQPDFAEKARVGLAKAYYQLKNTSKSLDHLVAFLINVSDTTPGDLRVEANDLFKKVSPIKSVIYVYTEPAGANVYLNDKKLETQTPLILSELSLGTYRLEVEKPGYEIYKTKVDLKISEFVDVKAKLKKQEL